MELADMGLSFALATAAPTYNPAPIEQATRDLFGYDIAWEQDFLLTPGGDYTRIGGAANLRAAVYRRLITRPGEFRFRPDYGVGVSTFVKKAPTPAVLDQLKVRIVEQLSQDTRIAQVDVRLADETIGTAKVLKVFVKVVAGGSPIEFEPFTFSREVA